MRKIDCHAPLTVYNPSHWIKTQSDDMQKLTPRQAEILSFIKRCLEDHGFPPTRAEIAQNSASSRRTPPRSTSRRWHARAPSK